MTTTADDRARIAARYPAARSPHATWVVVACLLAAVLGGWMTWAGLHGANKPVDADVHGFTVPSDTEARATLRVQRKDPARPVTCTVEATGDNFVKVGEREVAIAPGTDKITLAEVSLRTIHKATTVTVRGCRTA